MTSFPPPGPRRNLLLAAGAASIVSGVLAWRDLARRQEDEVRGAKLAWRVAILANPGNSYAYWLFGRR